MTAVIHDPEAALLGEAARWIGTRESPVGSNRGVAVDFFNYQTLRKHDDSHWRPYPNGVIGAPWCASFVSTIGRLALGAAWPVPSEVSVSRMVQWAERVGVFEGGDRDAPPRPADLFVLWYPSLGRWGHVGLVSNVDDSTIGTIEGNTGEAGQREGYGVLARRRMWEDSQVGIIRWANLLEGN